MTASAPDYSDLHQLVDRLTPAQARALRAVALELVLAEQAPAPAEPRAPQAVRRQLSFAGVGHGSASLAADSQAILHRELGDAQS